jgi:hypothetical protein
VQSSGRTSVGPGTGDDTISLQSKSPEKRTSFFRKEQEKRISIAEQLPQYPQLSLREALSKITPSAGFMLKPSKVLAPKRQHGESNEGGFDSVMKSGNQSARPAGSTPGTGSTTASTPGTGGKTALKQLPQYDISSFRVEKKSGNQNSKEVGVSAVIHVSVPQWGMDWTVQVKMFRNTVRALRSWLQRFSGEARTLEPKGKLLLDEMQSNDFDELEATCARGFSTMVKLQHDTIALEAGRGWLTPDPDEQPADESLFETTDGTQASRLFSRGSVRGGATTRRSLRGSVQGESMERAAAPTTSPEERQLQRDIQKLQSKIDHLQKRIKAADRKRLSAEMQLKVYLGTKRFTVETQTDPIVREVPGQNMPDGLKGFRVRGNLDQPKEDASWEEVAAWQDDMLDLLQQRMKELESPTSAHSGSPKGGMTTTVTMDGKTQTSSPFHRFP